MKKCKLYIVIPDKNNVFEQYFSVGYKELPDVMGQYIQIPMELLKDFVEQVKSINLTSNH